MPDAPANDTLTVAYRLAGFVRPLRTEPSRVEGRFHRADQPEPTQYLCLHPLGPWAEFMRANDLSDPVQLRFVRQRIWACRLDLSQLTRITFRNARRHGIAAEQLVSPSYRACQRFADRMRELGAAGLVVPSAALPGTENVVLFGARASSPYLGDPVSEIDAPAALAAEDARPPDALAPVVRQRAQRGHAALSAFGGGRQFRFDEPVLA